MREERLDFLDALRGIAILGVVLVHAGQLANVREPVLGIARAGQFGVQLFFIVSALTISLTFDAHIKRYGLGFRSALAWLIKRFMRIAPLYYMAIAFYAVEQAAIHQLFAVVGRFSYSVYILHFFVLDVVHALFLRRGQAHHSVMTLVLVYFGAVAATCVLAQFSKRYLEDPAIRLGHRWSDWMVATTPVLGVEQESASAARVRGCELGRTRL